MSLLVNVHLRYNSKILLTLVTHHSTYRNFWTSKTYDQFSQSVIQMMECPAEDLTQRTYNIAAFSFTPAEIIAEVQKYVPLTVEYKVDKTRQRIG